MRASAPHVRLPSTCSYDFSSSASSSSSDESSTRCPKCSRNSNSATRCPSRHEPHCRLAAGTKVHQVSDHIPGESASCFQHHKHNCLSNVCGKSSLKSYHSPFEISNGCLDLKSEHNHSKCIGQLEAHQCNAEKSLTSLTHRQCSNQEDRLNKEQHHMCCKVEICGKNVNVHESPYNSDDCVRNKKQFEFHSDAGHCIKPRQRNQFRDNCSENILYKCKPSRVNQSKNADNSEKKETDADKKVPSCSSTESSCLEDHLPKSFSVKSDNTEDKSAMPDKPALISRFPGPCYSSCLPNVSLSVERYSYAPICLSASKWNLPYMCRPVCGSLLRLSSRSEPSCSRFQRFPRRRPSCGHSFCQPGACCLKYSLTNPVCQTFVRYTSCFDLDPCRSSCLGYDPLCHMSWTSCSSTGSVPDPKPYVGPNFNFPKYGTSSFKTVKEEPEIHVQGKPQQEPFMENPYQSPSMENPYQSPSKENIHTKSTPRHSYNNLRPPSPPLPRSKVVTPKHSVEFSYNSLRPPSPPLPRSKVATPRHSVEFNIPEDEEPNKVSVYNNGNSIPSPTYTNYQHIVVKTVETYTQSTLTAPIMVDKFTQVDLQLSNQSTGTDVTDTSSKYTNTESKEVADKSTEFYTTETSTKNLFPTCFLPSVSLPCCCLGSCDSRKRLCFTPFDKFRNPFQRTPSYRQTVRCLDIYRSSLGENTETDVLCLRNNPDRPKNKNSSLKNRDRCYVYR